MAVPSLPERAWPGPGVEGGGENPSTAHERVDGRDVRYGIDADLSVDGDERYYVCSYVYNGERYVREKVITVCGAYVNAVRDIEKLKALQKGVA